MIRSLPLVRRTLLLSVCGLFLFSGRLFAGNPLLMPSEAPYGAPRFDRIHAADIMPAIEAVSYTHLTLPTNSRV